MTYLEMYTLPILMIPGIGHVTPLGLLAVVLVWMWTYHLIFENGLKNTKKSNDKGMRIEK